MRPVLTLLPILSAGLMNGSFVIPSRYIKNYTHEKIWFCHSLIGLGIIPWAIMLFVAPQLIPDYLLLPSNMLLLLIGSGVIFGIGQVCLAYAIEAVGVALSFTINLGLAVTIGSMFVVFYKTEFFTTQGYFVSLAVLLILSSLVIYYYSGKQINKQEPGSQTTIMDDGRKRYQHGWLLATLAGFTSGLQNIAFVIVASFASTHLQIEHSYWVWPPFLTAGAIPMLIGFLYKMQCNPVQNAQNTSGLRTFKNLLLIILMGTCFTGSLALYSVGMNHLTREQQIIGWPALMVSIILVSQAWGWVYKESRANTIRAKACKLGSIILLLLAIVILATKA